ncbi:gliding motility lipoprotein GldH [Bacteroides sp.]
MKNLLRNNIWLLIAGWLITACNENTVYHSYRPIPLEGWQKSDTLFFNVPVKDSLRHLHLSAEIRNKSNYAYRNLYLSVSYNLEDSTKWKTDTLLLILADKEGKWYGTGWGSLFQSTLPIGSVVVRHPGNYTFKIIHGMQDELLKGINDIGIKIERE